MVHMKATDEQQCVACEATFSLPAPDPLREYCDPYTEEIEDWHDSRDVSYEEHDAWAAQYDDDPNPYHGTYSEE